LSISTLPALYSSKNLNPDRFLNDTAWESKDNQERVKKLCEDGVIVPVLDREFSFDHLVDAHEHVMTGRKRGCVLVKVSGSGETGGAGEVGSESCTVFDPVELVEQYRKGV
jgi:hypothetical protein